MRAKLIADDVAERFAAAASTTGSGLASLDEARAANSPDLAIGVLMQANGCDTRTARALLELVAAARDGTDVAAVTAALIAAIDGDAR